ncbi:MAG: dihydrolipoyl dehydrogenase [Proteobacteria bacterium]|nr:dihydrolipoyl dehydrogenase [Pseudomonadota bacterium]MDA1059389.1 dihydrolipoyl dehydrogenase [Pseudomonadota bacterium]
MTDARYDIVVIGGGPGGYVAAIRAAQMGSTVACIESRGSLGGTCLNVGCIPSKALLQSSELFAEAQHGLAAHGINATKVALDLGKMLARKDKVVEDLTKGIAFLLKKSKIERLEGVGSISAPGKVTVTGPNGKTELTAKTIIVATGSEVASLPGVDIDEKRIVSSTGALSLSAVPKKMIVVGGGYIGLEMGSVWSRLGADVTVVEYLDRIVPGMDGEVAKHLQRVLTKQGLTFRLGSKVTKAKSSKSGVTLTVAPAGGGEAEDLSADVVLVSIGRKPFTDGLGLEGLGVKSDAHGFIDVDETYKTSVDGIYAIGDVIRGPMLAHKASEDGVACVEMLHGRHAMVDYGKVPGVVYTTPEVATVGRNEEDLKKDGIAYNVGKFPFMAVSRAKVSGATDGFIKILADAKTDAVLGVHIIGPDAGTLIHEAVLCMEFGGSAEDIAATCHAHPTLSEGMKEAALAVAGHAIHI